MAKRKTSHRARLWSVLKIYKNIFGRIKSDFYDIDDRFLAAFVRGCKGNIQKTKNVLENFNSLGVRYPYLFDDLDPLHPRLQELLSVA